MKMLLGLPETLCNLVEARYTSAKATQNLIFSPTELTIIHTSSGIPFQLRYCPSLAKKPQREKSSQNAAPKKKFNPFDRANVSQDLFVTDIPTTGSTHFLVLNKFPIIAEHFILATIASKQQTHELEADDLAATYACLKEWEVGNAGDGQKNLFAFFNSGDHSGASQPHRHLQFLPIERMKEGQQSDSWHLLTNLILSDASPCDKGSIPQLIEHPHLPFSHFAVRFPEDPSTDQLLDAYKALYIAARKAVDDFSTSSPDKVHLRPTEGENSSMSYNLAMTTSGMVIMPRQNEGCMLRRDDGSEIGFLALNGTTLGGSMMVKHIEEWDELRARPEKLDAILREIGIPKTA